MLAGVEHGLVLGNCRDDVVALLAVHFGDALDREVVALGCTRGKNDFLRGGANQLGDALARKFDRFFRRPSKGVIAARCVAELLHEIRKHLFQNTRIHRGGRVVIHIYRQLDSVGSRALSVFLTAGGRRLHDCYSPAQPLKGHLFSLLTASLKRCPDTTGYEIVTRSAGFGCLISIVSGSSLICEILMFFKTCSMLSFTFRMGSRLGPRFFCPHSPRTVTHEVIKSGPSIALITSKAEIVRGSRASVSPPFMPCWDCTRPTS